MTKSKIIAILALLALAISILYHRRTTQVLKAQIDALQTAAANASDAQGSANAPTENDAESERIAKDRSELMRLRAEVTALRGELQKSRGAVGGPKSPIADAKPAAASEPRLNFRTYNSTVSTTVPIGGAALSGGWVTAPGKRTFVFMSPAVVNRNAPSPEGQRHVVMSGKIVEIPDGVFQSNFPNVTHNPADDTYSGSIGANDMHDLLAKLESTEGVNVLAAPRVLTHDGGEASVAVTHSVIQDGQPVELGPQVTVVPRIAADGTFNLNINSKLTLLPQE